MKKKKGIIIYVIIGLIVVFLIGISSVYIVTTKRLTEQDMLEKKPKKSVYVDFDGVEHHIGEVFVNSWGVEEEITSDWIEWREEYDAIFEQMIKDDGLVIAEEDYSTLVEYYGIIYGMNETAKEDYANKKDQVADIVEIMFAYDEEMYNYWENGNKEDAIIVRKYVNKDLMEKHRKEIHDNFMILLNNQTKKDIQKGIDGLRNRIQFIKDGKIVEKETEDVFVKETIKQINLLEKIKKVNKIIRKGEYYEK